MIDQALKFICNQADAFLRQKLDPENHNPFLDLANIAVNPSGENSAGGLKNGSFLSLVNIQEERMLKNPENFSRAMDGSVLYRNPRIYLNLYILFSVNLSSYEESLKQLSVIIRFFQFKNVFTPLSDPSLPSGIEKLILTLHTLSFQEQNNLWAILGSKYLPSVLYQMRVLPLSEEFNRGQAELITEIDIHSNTNGSQ